MNAWEYEKLQNVMEDRITVEYFTEDAGRLAPQSASIHVDRADAVAEIADQLENYSNTFWAAFVITGDKRAFVDLTKDVDEELAWRAKDLALEASHESGLRSPEFMGRI